ncbi:hypothetical protein GCM10011309_13090 [Litorimonas cladophorae]|uniref:Uncharacterized protein n=1 Tax=Litorimonas cladophorae TaxID=1220491 RepID=A0A918KK74_9PROT|nr:hypothetical protein [Litorimonas cladophorae]GGX64343.1 hypothetical protein GCM10011309_13090 [Litorimonas cladophorae]
MSETNKTEIKKTLEEADEQGLSKSVEKSIEARLGKQPIEPKKED